MFYTYICECGKEKEVSHGMKEDPEIICECKKIMIRKITGGCGIIYKGNGWPSKNSALYSNPKKSLAEIGIKVDKEKKREMES